MKPESLSLTEDEEGCEAKSETLTGTSSQIRYGLGLLLLVTWTWFEVVCQPRSVYMRRFLTLVPSTLDPHPARPHTRLVEPQKILGVRG